MNLTAQKYINLSRRLRLFTLLKFLVPVFATAFVIHHVDFDHTIALITDIKISLFVLTLPTLFVQLLLAAERVRVSLNLFDVSASFRHVFLANYISTFFSQIFPTTAGDIVKVALLKYWVTDLNKAIQSSLLDRIFNLVALAISLVLSLMIMSSPNDKLSSNVWITSAIVLIVFCIFAGFILIIAAMSNRLTNLSILSKMMDIFEGLANRNLLRGDLIRLVVYSTVTHFNLGMIAFIIAKSMDISVDFFELFAAFTIALFVSSIPISIGSWGVREVTMVSLLGLVGVQGEMALAVSILYGLVVLVATLPAALTMFYIKNRKIIET